MSGTIKFYNRVTGSVVWSKTYEDIELLAGILAAGIGILNDINYRSGTEYYFETNADISSYRLATNIEEQNLNEYTCRELSERQYGLWLKSDKRYYYNLYGFRKPAFVQGIISICQLCEVDFRDYIYGLIFDKKGNQYVLNGYLMAPNQIAVDAPDLDDIEIEEADNENIIQPLNKDY